MIRRDTSLVESVRLAACRCSIFNFSESVAYLAVWTIMLVRCFKSDSSQGLGVFLACLSEEVQYDIAFPLGLLHAHFVCWHPEPLYALVCGPHQSDGNTNLDVSTRPIVGLPPLFCEADG